VDWNSTLLGLQVKVWTLDVALRRVKLLLRGVGNTPVRSRPDAAQGSSSGDGALLALFTDRWQVQWVLRDRSDVVLDPLVAEVDEPSR
jgi:hypothetical protein